MKSALDRRWTIRKVLEVRKYETVGRLVAEFKVSRSTILRDIRVLSITINIETVPGKNGGIYYRGPKPHHKLLSAELTELQMKTLKHILRILPKKEAQILIGILCHLGLDVDLE